MSMYLAFNIDDTVYLAADGRLTFTGDNGIIEVASDTHEKVLVLDGKYALMVTGRYPYTETFKQNIINKVTNKKFSFNEIVNIIENELSNSINIYSISSDHFSVVLAGHIENKPTYVMFSEKDKLKTTIENRPDKIAFQAYNSECHTEIFDYFMNTQTETIHDLIISTIENTTNFTQYVGGVVKCIAINNNGVYISTNINNKVEGHIEARTGTFHEGVDASRLRVNRIVAMNNPNRVLSLEGNGADLSWRNGNSEVFVLRDFGTSVGMYFHNSLILTSQNSGVLARNVWNFNGGLRSEGQPVLVQSDHRWLNERIDNLERRVQRLEQR